MPQKRFNKAHIKTPYRPCLPSHNPELSKKTMDKAITVAIYTLHQFGYTAPQIKEMCNKYLNLTTSQVKHILEREQATLAQMETIKEGLAEKFYKIADSALEHITEEKLQKTPAFQLLGMASLAVEKARLIEGAPTQNLSVDVYTYHKLAVKLDDLQKQRQKCLTLLEELQS